MSSTFTTNIGIERPALGDYVNTWSTPVNSDWTLVDQALGSSTSIPVTNANVTLTVAQSAFYLILITGTLTGNVELIFPGTIGGGRTIFNQTSGSFSVSILNGSGDTGGGVVIPQGYPMPIVLTAGRAYYDNYAAIAPGVTQEFGGPNIPPGFLLCFGQVVSQATYPLLFNAIGTTWGPATGGNFTLPDYRGVVLAGADNMGGSAAGRLTGFVLGTTGGNQAVTLSASQLPVTAYSDAGHAHTISDPGHVHGVGGQNNNSVAGGNNFVTLTSGSPAVNTATATTGITIQTGHASITNAGGGGSHPNVQPTAAVNIMIRY